MMPLKGVKKREEFSIDSFQKLHPKNPKSKSYILKTPIPKVKP